MLVQTQLKISDEQVHKIATALAPAIEASASSYNTDEKAAEMINDIYNRLDMNRKGGNIIVTSSQATISARELGELADYITSTYRVREGALPIAGAFASLRQEHGVNIKQDFHVLTVQPARSLWADKSRHDQGSVVDSDPKFLSMNQHPKQVLNEMLDEYNNAAEGTLAQGAKATILAEHLVKFLQNTKNVPLSAVYSNKVGATRADTVLTQKQTQAIEKLREIFGVEVQKEYSR